jgi:tetratricopeptide (TPR) repeat protein/tRNA A-37 threonylcarbamoyl transferase component Bud32
MGVVYKARQLSLNRTVALKMILAADHATPAELTRFVREAEAAAGLRHPNIVQVHEVGEHAGRPYMVLEYVEGGSLTKHAQDPLPAREAAAVVEPIARGVAFAHANGVVHRDLKPDNVLMADAEPKTPPGPAPRLSPSARVPKVTDFGLAKTLGGGDSTLTVTGAILGTPGYMAPEQAGGESKRAGPAADVWALGAILYRLLTGRPPFAAATPHETLYQVIAADPPSPSDLVPKLPKDLVTITLKCLRKDPARRYASADELADDLNRFLAGEPIRARPVSSAERAWKWARRNRGPVAAAAAVALALAAGAGVATWQALVATAKKDEADHQAGEARKQLATAEAVKDFLKRVLTQSSAQGQAGRGRAVDRDLTVTAAMGYAVAQLDGRFPDQPLIEAELRHVIGQTYRELGDTAAAAAQFRRGYELRAEHLHPDHPDALECLEGLALIHLDHRQLDEAERAITRVLAGRERSLGPDHEDTIGAVHNLAAVLSYRGQNDRAKELYEKALVGRERLLGPTNPFTLMTMSNLAGVHEEKGDHDRAEGLYALALARYEATLGPDHPDALAVAGNLAHLYSERGDDGRAERLGRRVLAGRRKVLGPDHRDTLTAAHNLGVYLADLGRGDLAEPLLARATAGRQAVLGPDHPQTLAGLNILALLHERQGDAAKAEPPLRALLAVREKQVPAVWSTHNTRSRLGGALSGQGRYAEAEPLLLAGFRGLVDRAADIPLEYRNPRLQEAATRLARLCAATGKPAEAARWRAEAARYREPAPPPRPAG